KKKKKKKKKRTRKTAGKQVVEWLECYRRTNANEQRGSKDAYMSELRKEVEKGWTEGERGWYNARMKEIAIGYHQHELPLQQHLLRYYQLHKLSTLIGNTDEFGSYRYHYHPPAPAPAPAPAPLHNEFNASNGQWTFGHDIAKICGRSIDRAVRANKDPMANAAERGASGTAADDSARNIRLVHCQKTSVAKHDPRNGAVHRHRVGAAQIANGVQLAVGPIGHCGAFAQSPFAFESPFLCDFVALLRQNFFKLKNIYIYTYMYMYISFKKKKKIDMFHTHGTIRYIVYCIMANVVFHPHVLLSHADRSPFHVAREKQCYMPKNEKAKHQSWMEHKANRMELFHLWIPRCVSQYIKLYCPFYKIRWTSVHTREFEKVVSVDKKLAAVAHYHDAVHELADHSLELNYYNLAETSKPINVTLLGEQLLTQNEHVQDMIRKMIACKQQYKDPTS
ncbi:hypothetical protein RFI_19462, partial [Reticulomyxa filosa]